MNGLVWQVTGEQTARLLGSNGRALTDYSWSADKNHPYFWNVRPSTHDGVLSNHAPWDHRWHHGLWWSWKFIDDVLYWEDHEDFGGNRRGLGRAVVVEHRVTRSDHTVDIAQVIEWRETNTGRVALREQRVMSLSEDVSNRSWSIDWDHTWSGSETVRLDVTPYPEQRWGGYAGLNFRAARSMAVNEIISASGDRTGVASIHGHPAEWVSIAGNADGAGSDDPAHPAQGGVMLISHPDNAWGGRSAYVFSASAEFGFAALAPLMHGGEQITAGSPLRLRYRTTIFGEQADQERLQLLAEAYTGAQSRSTRTQDTSTGRHVNEDLHP